MAYKVSEVADMAGVSVRTLHHYDQIGLLRPDSITPAGYRLYSDANLKRLQQILFFREIGFELRDIKRILDDPDFDETHALRAQRDLLMKKRKRLDEIIRTVEAAIDSTNGGMHMDGKKMFGAFDMSEIEKHKEKYAEEVRQKYDPKVVEESERRTSKYGKNDWERIAREAGEIYNQIAALMDKGPADPEVQKLVAEWREHISKYFYTCTPEIFRGLGDLYVEDERFTANIDKYGKGLSAFLREAMHIYCDNLEDN